MRGAICFPTKGRADREQIAQPDHDGRGHPPRARRPARQIHRAAPAPHPGHDGAGYGVWPSRRPCGQRRRTPAADHRRRISHRGGDGCAPPARLRIDARPAATASTDTAGKAQPILRGLRGLLDRIKRRSGPGPHGLTQPAPVSAPDVVPARRTVHRSGLQQRGGKPRLQALHPQRLSWAGLAAGRDAARLHPVARRFRGRHAHERDCRGADLPRRLPGTGRPRESGEMLELVSPGRSAARRGRAVADRRHHPPGHARPCRRPAAGLCRRTVRRSGRGRRHGGCLSRSLCGDRRALRPCVRGRQRRAVGVRGHAARRLSVAWRHLRGCGTAGRPFRPSCSMGTATPRCIRAMAIMSSRSPKERRARKHRCIAARSREDTPTRAPSISTRAGAASSSTGRSMVPDTPGRAAVPPVPIPIRAGRTPARASTCLLEEADQSLGAQVMENFFITLAVVAFAGLVVFCFVIEPRMKH